MIRLFYDRYTSRTRAELTLVAADMLALAAATLFLAPAFLGDAPAADKALLVLWAVTPRALARIVSSLEHPTDFVRLLSAAVVAVTVIAALLGVGYDLIYSTSPPQYVPTPLGLGTLLCAWGAGFLVCQPGFYRLFDFFLGGALLVGLKDGAPQPYVWIPVFLLALCLSGAIRHLLYDVFRDRRSPPINLQNARTVALLGAGASAVVFVVICLILGGGRFPEPPPRLDLSGAYSPPARSPYERATRRDAFQSRPDALIDQRRGAALEGNGHTSESDSPDAPRRSIGFTQHVRLSDLARPEFETAVVLRIKAQGSTSRERPWRPVRSALWKGVTFATYDPESQGWEQPTLTEEAPWPTRLARDVPRGLEGGEAVTLVHVVVNPVFQSFITPYFTREIRTESPADEVRTYIRGLPGNDIFPRPGFVPYSRYVTHSVLTVPNRVPDADVRVPPGAADVDARYLDVPSPDEIGVDLRALATRIFAGTDGAGVAATLDALRRYYQEGFEYSNDEDWSGGDKPLREFLERRRRGDCTYFATASALLLRAAERPTRFVAGFSGGDWEPTTGEVVVRNGRAHGWIEVHVRGFGWFPVDATLWVESATDATPAERVRGTTELDDPEIAEEGDDQEAVANRESPDTATQPASDDRRALSQEQPPTDRERDSGSLFSEAIEDVAETGVVRGIRSFVRTEGLDGRPRRAGAASPTASDVGPGGASPVEFPVQPPATSALRAFLSPRVRATLRVIFLAVSLLIAGRLVLVYLRPTRRDRESEGEDEEEDAPLQLPADMTSELIPVFDPSSPRDRVLAAYCHLQAALKATRCHRRPHQTPLEHAHRLAKKRAQADESFEQIHRVLYRALYGGYEVNDDEARSVEIHCQKLRRSLG